MSDAMDALDARRPAYVGEDWLRCTEGMTFASPPPAHLRGDAARSSPNAWERLVAATLRAQSGDFRDPERLLSVAELGLDDHLRDCAVRVFAYTAPRALVNRLASLFAHASEDTRLEAYTAASLSCEPSMALALAAHRRLVRGYERDRVMDAISDLLDEVDAMDFADSALSDDLYEASVTARVASLRARHGQGVAVFQGRPVDAARLAAVVAEHCAHEDVDARGGAIYTLLCLLEAMTGVGFAGCLDDDCVPVLPRIASVLNGLHGSDALAALTPGRRYFFGHVVPDEAP